MDKDGLTSFCEWNYRTFEREHSSWDSSLSLVEEEGAPSQPASQNERPKERNQRKEATAAGPYRLVGQYVPRVYVEDIG